MKQVYAGINRTPLNLKKKQKNCREREIPLTFGPTKKGGVTLLFRYRRSKSLAYAQKKNTKKRRKKKKKNGGDREGTWINALESVNQQGRENYRSPMAPGEKKPESLRK